MTAHKIILSRAYDARAGVHARANPHGAQLLVDRLWPRGIAKTDLPIDAWLKDLTPSTALRKWFGHDPEKWDTFRSRYLAELTAHPKAVEQALEWCRKGQVTLLSGAKDTSLTHAIILRDFLTEQLDQETPNA